MKTRITFLSATVIATSAVLLLLTTNYSASGRSPSAATDTGAHVESDLKLQSDLLGSRTIGTAVSGIYDLSFRKYRNGVLEPVSSLPLGGGPLVLFAHVEDANGNPAQSGTVTFEYCGNYEPKENCDAGLARWSRLNGMNIGSCYCKSCGGLPDYDPGPGNACLFVFTTGGSNAGDEGFRFKYAGKKSGVDSGISGAANFTWTTAAILPATAQ